MFEEKNTGTAENKEKKNLDKAEVIIGLIILLVLIVTIGPGGVVSLMLSMSLPVMVLIGVFLLFAFIFAPELFTSSKRNRDLEKRCWSYINNGFYERAIEFDNSIDESEKSPSVYACIGTAYYNTGNLELALQRFKKAEEKLEESIYSYKDLKLDIRIYTHIAEILHKMGNYNESIEYYNKAVEKVSDEKDRGDIFIKIAKVYEEKGDVDNAIKYYQDALVYGCQTCDKEKAEIYKKIALLYEKKGDEANTKRYLDKASELEKAINQNN
jgi:tetratricopeptide (TPR) repeat protein